MKEKYQISMSGGRTSAYMAKHMIDNFSDQYDFIVTFANTGLEHPKTLEFIDNCDKHFGFNTVWLEAVVNERQVGTSHKVVTFETASRNAEPFEAVINKYGIPNLRYLHCTRELKLAPMQTYLKSLGIDYKKIKTAIGIRIDELRRVSAKASEVMIEYPLVDLFPTDKHEVLHWWSKQRFDLGIEEFQGNCLGCFKKSNKKQFMQIENDSSVFDWFRSMDDIHKRTNTKENDPDRVFFRGNLDTVGLFKLYDLIGKHSLLDLMEAPEENGGCSESCEVYNMEA